MARPLLVLLLCLGATALSAAPAVDPEDVSVMGRSLLGPWLRAQFLHRSNPQVDLGTALNLSLLYEEEADREGVNPDLAFAQMVLETSYLRFGGQVRAGQNNFSGLGALDGGDRGLVFPSPRLGIRAQVQHLKYYATTDALVGAPVNPRLIYVRRASAPNASQLARAWASDPEYGRKLLALLARMRENADLPSAEPTRSTLPPVAPSPVPGH